MIVKTRTTFLIIASALVLGVISPARAQQRTPQPATPESADPRDLVHQADALMTEAAQFGQRAEMIQRVKGAAVASGGSGSGGSSSDDPAIAAKSSGGGDIGAAIARYKQMENDRWQQADKLYRQALDAKPATAEWHVKLAEVEADLGHKDVQLAEAIKACELEPQNAEWAADLGNIYYDRKNWSDAESSYKKAEAIAPQNAAYHFDLASVYWAQKRWPEADAEAKQAVSLDPNNAIYLQTADDIANRKPFKR